MFLFFFSLEFSINYKYSYNHKVYKLISMKIQLIVNSCEILIEKKIQNNSKTCKKLLAFFFLLS